MNHSVEGGGGYGREKRDIWKQKREKNSYMYITIDLKKRDGNVFLFRCVLALSTIPKHSGESENNI